MKLFDKVSKKQALILVILILGLIAGVILVQTYKTLKGRAQEAPENSVIITDDQGNPIQSLGNNTYNVEKGTRIQIDVR